MKRKMAVRDDACANAASTFGKLQNMGGEAYTEAPSLIHLNVIAWRYI
jgi:hypothetical protein